MLDFAVVLDPGQEERPSGVCPRDRDVQRHRVPSRHHRLRFPDHLDHQDAQDDP